ncbi:hypothetical protein HPB52_021413 [Rhipicephalus sanguineus]|uniref:Uncharacterized protein n=1 Tax=Rhipicephalus sanguineus TaxID=34632 RepID=A0A9D4PFE4_RHISA|nr:hypothetical protein HPB52_021413 [Rhipicephalus sanguineus]
MNSILGAGSTALLAVERIGEVDVPAKTSSKGTSTGFLHGVDPSFDVQGIRNYIESTKPVLSCTCSGRNVVLQFERSTLPAKTTTPARSAPKPHPNAFTEAVPTLPPSPAARAGNTNEGVKCNDGNGMTSRAPTRPASSAVQPGLSYIAVLAPTTAPPPFSIAPEIREDGLGSL